MPPEPDPLQHFQVFADIVSKWGQVVFFAITAFLAILTYRNAIRGLWSSVNTEYYKRIIESLARVSEELIAEEMVFEENEERSWIKLARELEEIKVKVKEQALKHDTAEKFAPMIPIPNGLLRFHTLSQRAKSDPFLPKEIREEVSEFYSTRFEIYSEVYSDVLRLYAEDVRHNRHGWDVSNTIQERLSQRGCDVPQVSTEIHDLRLKIQSYLDSLLKK